MIFTLPWPLSANMRFAVSGGRIVLNRAYRTWKENAASYLAAQREGALEQIPPPIRMRVYAYPPDRRRRDLDNLLKAALDAITRAGVIADDSHIDELWITRLDPCPGGKLLIDVETKKETAIETALQSSLDMGKTKLKLVNEKPASSSA